MIDQEAYDKALKLLDEDSGDEEFQPPPDDDQSTYTTGWSFGRKPKETVAPSLPIQ